MTTRFSLVNKTDWDTRDLRRIIARSIRQKHMRFSAFKVYVQYRRAWSSVNGRARYNGGPVWLNLRRDVVHVPSLVVTILHELDHVNGLRHRDMVIPAGHTYAWAETMPLRRKAQPIAPAPEERAAAHRDDRIKRAEQAVARWTRKSKLAQTKLRAWTRSLSRLKGGA